MACDFYVTIKILELMLSIACIVYKRVSDDEGRRLNTRQEKQNYEWPLLRYITWEQNGSSYADITYGSYVIITTGLLIGYLSGELAKGRNMETFLLGFGALLFIAVGSLELAALDSVPDELIDNAAILGVVSLLTGFLFLLDLGLSGKRRKQENLRLKLKHSGPSKLTQTDEKLGALNLLTHKMNGLLTNGSTKSHEQIDKNDKVVGQLKSSLKGKKNEGETMRVTFPSDILNPPPEVPLPVDYPTNLHETARDVDLQDRDSTPGSFRGSQKLRRGDPIPKLPKPREESDGDDSLNIPTVSFIMRERGDLGSQSSLRAKSPSFRARMLPMMPIEKTQDVADYKTPGQLDKSLSQPELTRSPQKYDSEGEESREIVMMSPAEKSEFIAYKKLMKNLASRSQDIPKSQPYGSGNFDAVLKTTYSTEEIIEPKPQISPIEYNQPHTNQQRLSKPKTKPKPERPKGYVEQKQRKDSPRDFSEDISHMSPSERERYLFGESPKQKESTSTSPTQMDQRSSKKTSPVAQSISPEADAHWRFDSRDANLSNSFRGNPRDSRDSPSSPMDPGYVLHAASNWPHSAPHSTPKTPSQSPSDVAAGTSPKTPYRISSDESDTNTTQRNGTNKISREPYPYSQPMRMSSAPPPPPPHTHPLEMLRREDYSGSPHRREYLMDEDDDATSPSGSLTTQLLQKWIKQRHTKVAKVRSEP